MQKVRSRARKDTSSLPSSPTVCRHTVSGALSLPSRGAFHLSLTVLVHYRSLRSISPWRMVPPDSHRIARVLWYSGTQLITSSFRLRGYHTVSRAFPDLFS